VRNSIKVNEILLKIFHQHGDVTCNHRKGAHVEGGGGGGGGVCQIWSSHHPSPLNLVFTQVRQLPALSLAARNVGIRLLHQRGSNLTSATSHSRNTHLIG
jgi:hypothetical protein